MTDIDQAKEVVRDRVWQLFEREGAVPEISYSKIYWFIMVGVGRVSTGAARQRCWGDSSKICPAHG